MSQTIEKEVTVELDTGEIADLFEKEFDGWCHVCKDTLLNVGEIICCNCLKEALTYHINTCGCYP